MSLSRIEADRFDPPTGAVAVPDVIDRAVANAGEMAARHKCKIAIDLAKDLPPIRGDDGQLLQLLDNLLANALRYGCQGRQCEVQVAAVLDGPTVRIEVRDNGRGIPPEHLRRVTERFYRVDAARGADSGGTGLGLAIVKHIVERHRGTLEIHSNTDEGTTVVVRLPAASA
jgi:two-component system phosphate regulon sensor histidine kinase PhoR